MVEQTVEPQNDMPGFGSQQEQPLDGELKWLPLDSLFESSWNPRQYYPESAMAELVESMRSSGYREWLPLMVRPISKQDGLEQFDQQYEIGAGHRRSRAAREAGITIVPCIVRPMTDEQFLDVLNFDNTGREDVHPLHEAAGWQQWMEKTGKGVLDIAARIGQSKEYVYQRLKYASLIDPAKKAFLDGEITAGHAILIARLQAPEQQKALKYVSTADWQQRRPGVRQLAEFIQSDVHLQMGSAGFDLDSAELLPAAGSCTVCPKRTKNSRELLLGVEIVDDPEQDDCTDPSCFHAKLKAHLVQIKTAIEAQGAKPIEVSSHYGKAPKGVCSRNDYAVVAEGVKGSQIAIVADGHEAGKVVHVKINPPRPPSGSGQVNSEAAKRAEEKRQAQIDLELSVRRKVLDEIVPKVKDVSRVDLEVLVGLALCSIRTERGELSHLFGKDFQGYKTERAWKELIAKKSDAEIYKLAICLPLLEDFYKWTVLNTKPEALLAAAKRYKVDAAKIRIQVEASAKQAAESKPPADKKPPVVPPAAKKAAAKKKAAKPAAKKKGKGK